jgi:serine/threonine protein kinase
MLRTDNDITSSVILDFDLGQIIGKQKIFTRCGSPGYIAPEVIFYNQINDYDCKIDIFSLIIRMLKIIIRMLKIIIRMLQIIIRMLKKFTNNN